MKLPAAADSDTVNVYFDSTNVLHRDMRYHPECPERIKVCVDALKQERENVRFDDPSLLQNVNLIDVGRLDFFSEEQLKYARSMLVEAHSEEYVSLIQRKCQESKAARIEEGKAPLGYIGYTDGGMDTYMTTETYDVCLRAAATWIRVVDDVLNHGCSSFALTRPPGHHATRAIINGFCFFNFAASAAIHAIKMGKRVSVLDWDVHYGQGVSDILQDEEMARYVSLHQVPAFPYEGERQEFTGANSNILTIPILPESTWTCGYKDLFQNEALPFLVGQDWKPDICLICAGYDALADDELASVNLAPIDYYNMVVLLRSKMKEERLTSNKLALGLEGGYKIRPNGKRGLSEAFISTIKSLVSY